MERERGKVQGVFTPILPFSSRKWVDINRHPQPSTSSFNNKGSFYWNDTGNDRFHQRFICSVIFSINSPFVSHGRFWKIIKYNLHMYVYQTIFDNFEYCCEITIIYIYNVFVPRWRILYRVIHSDQWGVCSLHQYKRLKKILHPTSLIQFQCVGFLCI